MICYICHQPSVGQCQACWKFYCESHGDVACQPCQQQLDAAHQPGRGTGRISVRQDVRRQSASPGSAPPPSPEEQPLQRVIGVAQTAGQGETEVTLVSLELYAAGFIANFRLRGKPPNQPITGPYGGIYRPDYYPEASDDLGNVYYGSPRGGGGGSHEWRSSMSFNPAPLAEAKILNFNVAEVRWMAHGPGQRSSIQPGPWEFQVEL